VNVLEPHPTTCILATAGLEHNIKVWTPVGVPFKRSTELVDVSRNIPFYDSSQ